MISLFFRDFELVCSRVLSWLFVLMQVFVVACPEVWLLPLMLVSYLWIVEEGFPLSVQYAVFAELL